MTYLWPFLSVLSAVFAMLSMVFFLRALRVARSHITDLKQSLQKEQRLSTQLREMLSKVGVETIVIPTSGDYLLSFKAHFPPPNLTHALRAWRGPVRH